MQLNDSIKLKNAAATKPNSLVQKIADNAQKSTTSKVQVPGIAANEKTNNRF